MDISTIPAACHFRKASSVRDFTPLCFFRFKVNPNPHWTASEWDTEVCLVPSSPWWELRAPGVCIVDWWQDFTDRWALPQSALACMTPWSSSTPGGQNVCVSVYYNVIAIFIFYCRLFLTRHFHFSITESDLHSGCTFLIFQYWLTLWLFSQWIVCSVKPEESYMFMFGKAGCKVKFNI